MNLPKKIWMPILFLAVLLFILFIIFRSIPEKFLLIKNPVNDNSPWLVPYGHDSGIVFILWWVFLGSYFFKNSLWSYIVIFLLICFIYIVFEVVLQFKTKIKKVFAKNTIQNMFPFLLGLVSFALFFYFKVSADQNVRFGDALAYPGQIENGLVNQASLLNDYIFIGMRMVLDAVFGGKNGVLAIQLATSIYGGLFVGSLAVFVNMIGKNYFEKVTLFLGVLTGGYVLMFFGYIETTALSLALMALLFAFVTKYIFSGYAEKWFYATIFILPLIIMAHLGGILLMIAIPMILLKSHNENWKDGLFKLFTWRNMAIIFMICILPIVLTLLAKYFYPTISSDITTDYGPFVPLTDENVGRLNRGRPFYSMFSFNHLADVVSVLLLSSPFGLSFLAAATYIRKKYITIGSEQNTTLLWILGSSAICSSFIPLLWHHDFTTYGDWNISATYLFPLNVFAWTAFILAIRKFKKTIWTQLFFTAIIGVQILLTAGLYIQLV